MFSHLHGCCENTFYVKTKVDQAESDEGLVSYLCDFSINLKLFQNKVFFKK